MRLDSFGDNPSSRCVFYREVCGLDALVQAGTGRILVQAKGVWCVRMPGVLGQSVRADMHARRQAVGPIISHPRSGSWSFLVRPDVSVPSALSAQLFRVRVAVLRAGAEIALPSPADRQPNLRYWLEPPRDRYRPSAALILASLARSLPARAIDVRLLDVTDTDSNAPAPNGPALRER
ncbi:DNA-directed RNA polymerase subunit beta [Nocardia cyriacigeorgica]|uniref:DNA-directed RNA polymerase subunit beta n=1 Tax=Nocardia cyriacigeorgica TaxID=135487 RepID=UPI0024538807|nr:DNA-directed RNA polymerase subunit beta [Nocardia cyriacigeorgica]